jgi:hypothetical protein
MAIIIVDNFQVDINNPIDNRFVVGSQSIPSGGTYPTPFYAYRNDIVYKYPGLRIWDFNDNIPYVWNGTTWINENTTGAIVFNSGQPGGTGYKDYVTKFADNQTLLIKSNIYDNGTHVGIGLTGSAMQPSTTPYPIAARNNGLHVDGHIRTNGYFIGKIYADYIVDGSLNLARISTLGTNPTLGTYLLKNISGVTSWDLLSNIVPTGAINLVPTTTGTGITIGNIYAGVLASQYEFKPLVSSGLQITDSANEIRIESKVGLTSSTGIPVYSGLNTDNRHVFKNITSNTLVVTSDTNNNVTIDVPATFEGTDYYVNGFYNGVQLGTRSKPFSTLQNCLDKILNRGSFKDPLINNNQSYEKWEIRTGPGAAKPTYQNNYSSTLPGGGAVRVIIQSYVEAFENLAIQGVTYFLEKGGYASHIVVLASAVNDVVTGQPFEYLFDTTPLVDNIPRGNPYYTTNGNLLNANPGELDYNIDCNLEGSGTITFAEKHPTRKGFFKHKGSNSYDWLIANSLPPLSSINFPPQHGSNLTIGSIGGNISFNMSPLPSLASHISATVSITTENGSPFIREGVPMVGYQTTTIPNYGLIQVEGRNSMFFQSLYLNGTLVLGANEQHMIYAKDYGSIYSDNGRIYMRRNYQHVVYQNIEYIKVELPHDTYYLGTNTWYRIVSAGTTTTAQWNTLAGTIAGGSPGTWRNSSGVPLTSAPNYPTGSSSWVDLVFQATGHLSGPALGTGTITNCGKRYTPSSFVHDIYLKNGASFQHGGDFYTQQNTSATEGGPDTFVCLENSIIRSGDTTHPNRNGRSSTFCEFAANGGGYITNLHYNYYIKTIMDSSYLDDESHYVSFKSVKIDSNIFKSVIRAENTSGTSWNKIYYAVTFKNCYIGNTIYGGPLILPISNMPIYSNDGVYTGKMIIGGTTIDLPGGFINTSIPIFTSNALAVAGGLSVGNIYKDTSGNLKVVI